MKRDFFRFCMLFMKEPCVSGWWIVFTVWVLVLLQTMVQFKTPVYYSLGERAAERERERERERQRWRGQVSRNLGTNTYSRALKEKAWDNDMDKKGACYDSCWIQRNQQHKIKRVCGEEKSWRETDSLWNRARTQTQNSWLIAIPCQRSLLLWSEKKILFWVSEWASVINPFCSVF